MSSQRIENPGLARQLFPLEHQPNLLLTPELVLYNDTMSVRAILGLERTNRLSETIHTCNQNIVYSPQGGQSCGSWMSPTNSSQHLPHWNSDVSRQMCSRLLIEVFRCPHVDPYLLLHFPRNKRHVRAQCQKGPRS